MKWNKQEWEKVELKDIFLEIKNGKSIKQSADATGIPITRIETIWNSSIDLNRLGFANITDKDKYKSHMLQKGDILMSHINSLKHLGKTAIFDGTEEIIHGMNLLRLIPNLNRVDPKFAYYHFNSPIFKNIVVSISNQSVNQCSFSVSKIKPTKIPLPPLQTQREIAELLDTADALRQKTQAQLDALDELAQSIFLEMFGDPVTNEKGWEVRKLGDVTINLDSKRIPVKQSDRDKMEEIYDYYGATGAIDKVDNYTHEGDLLLIAEDGKALVNRNKPIAFMAYGKFWVNNHSHVLNKTECTNLRYLEHYFANLNIRKFVTGIDQYKLNKTSLMAIPINLPPISLQNQFATIIENIEAQKVSLKASLQESDDLFGCLLQEVFG